MKNATTPPNLNLPTKLVAGIVVPVLDKPYTQMLAAIEGEYELAMDTIHGQSLSDITEESGFCGTVHCIAGLTLHLCGAQGKELEGLRARVATRIAKLILNASSALSVPEFFPESYLSESEIDVPGNDETWSEETMELVNARAIEEIRWRAAEEQES